MGHIELSDLPNEILAQIIPEVKRCNTSNSSLLACLLVSRRWHDITLSVLYCNVVLRLDVTLQKFVEQFEVDKYASLVRSLTIRHGSSGREIQDISIPLEDNLLKRLAAIIQHLPKLSSFSLLVYPSSEAFCELLDALPPSCISLEVDTMITGYTHRHSAPSKGPKFHTCDSIYNLLPRLQDLRIRKLEMCEHMFARPAPSSTWIPAALPKMKTLLVNCDLPQGYHIVRCWKEMLTWPSQVFSWSCLTSVLESLVARPNSTLPDAKLYIMTCARTSGVDQSIWPTLIRTEMLAKESLAFPYRRIQMESSSWLVRLHDGRELLGTLDDIEALTEGQVWRDVVGGARLPASVLAAEAEGKPSYATGCVEKPLQVKTSEQWREENPKKGNALWWNERLAGTRLLEVEFRKGDKYLNTNNVVEGTPDGWMRGEAGDLYK